MKKSILLLSSLVLMALNTFSQSTYNLVLFSEDGDGFFAFVNGIRQNDKPETNVKITGLTAQGLSLRVEFENKAYPTLKKDMPMEVGFEYTIKIKRDLKKQMKLQYFGQVALGDAPKSSASTVQYHTAENPVSSGSNNSSTQFNTATNTSDDNSSTTVSTTSTSTHVNTNTNSNGVGVNVNINGMGINMNVNDPTLNNNTTVHSTTSTTVTSSSSSSNSSPKNPKSNSNPTTMPVDNTQPVSSGCTKAMADASFQKLKKSVEDKPFSDTKMSTAKVATKNACLSSAQIKDICSLFSMDDDKLTYAKYAYAYCVDKANFYQVSEIFSFSTTTDDLNKFIEQQ